MPTCTWHTCWRACGLPPSFPPSLLSSHSLSLSLFVPLKNSTLIHSHTHTHEYTHGHTYAGLYILGRGSQHWCYGQDWAWCDRVLGGRPCRYWYIDGHIHQELWSQWRIHSSQPCELAISYYNIISNVILCYYVPCCMLYYLACTWLKKSLWAAKLVWWLSSGNTVYRRSVSMVLHVKLNSLVGNVLVVGELVQRENIC